MKNILSISGVACAVVALASSANAIPTLYVSDASGDSVTFSASGGGTITDSGSVTVISHIDSGNQLTLIATVGGWTFTDTVGTTVNGGGDPQIDLNLASAIATAGATTLTVWYSDNGFGPTDSSVKFAPSGSGLNGSTLTEKAYGGNSDTLDDTTHQLMTGSLINTAGPYSLTIVDTLTAGNANGAANVNSADSILTVPDGGMTLVLLGSALSGLALLKKKLI